MLLVGCFGMLSTSLDLPTIQYKAMETISLGLGHDGSTVAKKPISAGTGGTDFEYVCCPYGDSRTGSGAADLDHSLAR